MNVKNFPEDIYKRLKSNHMDVNDAVQMLLFLIENSEDQDKRKNSVKILGEIGRINEKSVFSILENLMLSDNNKTVRMMAAEVIKNKFPHKAIEPMSWLISHEFDYDCAVKIIELFGEINDDRVKKTLVDVLINLVKTEIINIREKHQLKKFQETLMKMIEKGALNDLLQGELAEILVNYKTIDALVEKFVMVYYELENCRVVDLDLSELMNNFVIRGQPYPTNISDISEITGLFNLKHLQSLNISNNRISDIRGLEHLKNLAKINLSRNSIKDIEIIDQLKKLKSLKILNLSGNDVLDKIDLEDFSDMELIIRPDFY